MSTSSTRAWTAALAFYVLGDLLTTWTVFQSTNGTLHERGPVLLLAHKHVRNAMSGQTWLTPILADHSHYWTSLASTMVTLKLASIAAVGLLWLTAGRLELPHRSAIPWTLAVLGAALTLNNASQPHHPPVLQLAILASLVFTAVSLHRIHEVAQ